MAQQEIHLELLLSKRVVDTNAQLAGRIEEVCAEQQGEETVIQEYLLGPDALGARLAVWLTGLRMLHWLGVGKSNRSYRVPWDKMDLTDPRAAAFTLREGRVGEMRGLEYVRNMVPRDTAESAVAMRGISQSERCRDSGGSIHMATRPRTQQALGLAQRFLGLY